MAAILSLLVIAASSLLVARVATVALTVTGMTREHARFQARRRFTDWRSATPRACCGCRATTRSPSCW